MDARSLRLTRVECCICDTADARPVGAGADYEYRTSNDIFTAVRCVRCELIYLNPRPDVSEFPTIYPPSYHAFDFAAADYGLVYKVRARLEANRLLSWLTAVPDDATILDVGCGDGFHLKLLQAHGKRTWRLEGIDLDERAALMAAKAGLKVHVGRIEALDLPKNSVDAAIMIQTIEHVEKPDVVLSAIKNVLKPGGRLIVVTDNTDCVDFRLFGKRYWGGYHFPRHWNLFNGKSLRKLAQKTGLQVADLTTQVSPVNWVYSIHNFLVDKGAPRFLINRFTLKSAVSLAAFTALDMLLRQFGKGALLRAILQKPLST